MRRKCRSLVVLTGISLAAAPALGGGLWVDFVNETDTRMNPAIPVNDVFGKDDQHEKDYAWGDVDLDGDIDLVVVRKLIGSNSTGKVNRLFMNEGGVLIDRTTDFATDATDGGQGFNDITADRDVVLIDLNGDGWLDIVTASAGAYSGGPKTITHPRVFRNLGNDGGGNWQGFRYEESRIPTLIQTPNFCAIAFGDVDGLITSGGPPDLYFTDYTNTLEDRILVNNGSGSFSDVTLSRFSGNTGFLDASFSPHAVMADINGDGYNDILKDAALGPYHMKIASNDPGAPGTLSSGNTEIIYASNTYFVAVDDLNNDGMLDIVEVDDGFDRYFLNVGNGPNGLADFHGGGNGSTFPDTNGFGSNVVIADLDKDGFKDVLIADVDVDLAGCTGHRLKIQHNLGGPPIVTFAEDTANIPTGTLTGTHDVAIFDINGDTWLDLVIGTCTGTTIWINQPPFALSFSYPLGLPAFASLDGSTEIQVLFDAVGEALDPTSPTLHVSINGGSFTGIPMTEIGANLYSANLPAAACLDTLAFYVSGALSGGASFTDPPAAPLVTFGTVAVDGTEILLLDDIEGDVSAWTITSDPSLTQGEWEQADPIGTISGGLLAAPDDDATPPPGVLAFVTQNGPPGGAAANYDVDGGPAYLTSPVLDISGTDAVISYQRWFFSDGLPNDQLTIEVSNNGGGSWVSVGTVTSTGSAWEPHSFVVSDYVTPTANVQVRFFTSDSANDSITEAGIDDFQVEVIVCGPGCPTDINGDGATNVLDLVALLLCFGQPAVPGCEAEDVNGDGSVNVLDLVALLLEFGNACP